MLDTLVNMFLHLKCSMKIKRHVLHDTSSLYATWQNMNSLSSIRRTGFNNVDSHPSVSSEMLIKDEEANQTVTPKCSLFIPLFFDGIIMHHLASGRLTLGVVEDGVPIKAAL